MMHDAPISSDAADAADAARKIVDTYLTVLMKPDPEGARRYVAADLRIRFTGGRAMDDPAQCTAFNASRYRWVKKRFESTDVVVGATPRSAVVYNRGTLYGEWLDGTPFEGNRYVDRYVLREGLIVEMDVWNDSAEWMLSRAQGTQP
ncbi:Putative inner membrane protein [plant metagenome]|uniref:Inner membrane protein n=2 Tax=plant metagenome TaxID=1297885 RepID=A0A484YAI2_9ZZZZ